MVEKTSVTILKGAIVKKVGTPKDFRSEKTFKATLVQFKMGWCYYDVNGQLYRADQKYVKEASV